MYDIANS